MKELFDAIARQDVESVRKLTQSTGFKPDATEDHGAGYMFIAAGTGNVEIGQILKEAGVQISLNDRDGLRLDILDYAKEHPQFLEFLRQNGIDLGRIEKFMGKTITLIGSCAFRGLADTVEYLLNAGVKPTEDDIKTAKDMLEYVGGRPSAKKDPATELLVNVAYEAIQGVPISKAREAVRPFERIVSLLEKAVAIKGIEGDGIAIGLGNVDPKFRNGANTKSAEPNGSKKAFAKN